MREFEEKVALVVAGGTGIGREIACQLAKSGASVMIACRGEKNGLETVQMIKDDGGEASFVKTDIAIIGNISNMVEKTVEQYGHLDIAVNAATSKPDMFSLETLDETAFDENINVDLKGVIFSMKYQVQQMVKQRSGGCIVNFSSAGVV